MFKLVTAALSLMVLVASSQAWAAPAPTQEDLFTFSSSGGSYSWVLDASPTVSSLYTYTTVDSNNVTTTNVGGFVVNAPSSFPTSQVVFYSGILGGGFSDSTPKQSIINFDTTSQLYTGGESNPTFTLGLFPGINETCGTSTSSCAGTLKISAITPIAAVPEPETYGMMMAGLGLMGFMVRRKNSV